MDWWSPGIVVLIVVDSLHSELWSDGVVAPRSIDWWSPGIGVLIMIESWLLGPWTGDVLLLRSS